MSEKEKCDRCGLRSPTMRKILRRIENIGNQIDIIYEQVCTICLPVVTHQESIERF